MTAPAAAFPACGILTAGLFSNAVEGDAPTRPLTRRTHRGRGRCRSSLQGATSPEWRGQVLQSRVRLADVAVEQSATGSTDKAPHIRRWPLAAGRSFIAGWLCANTGLSEPPAL